MKHGKQLLSLVLALVLVLSCTTAALAAGTFSDVPSGAYYEEAVEYCCENGLISGTGGGRFSPDTHLSRAMLATILWRSAGQPTAGQADFSDVVSGSYYETAVAWAAENGIVSGYGGGLFGPDDDVSRQQVAAMLYRYAAYRGEDVTASESEAFADDASIADYAREPVSWARASGIISGKSGNLFDPDGSATRAEAAAIVYRYLNLSAETETQLPTETLPATTPETEPEATPETGKTLVVYFTWSGNTEDMATYIAEQTGGDLYEILAADPYPEDYTETGNRAEVERDENQRPAIANLPESLDGYDTIFIGYPIWWHTAPMIIGTFLESYDLTGIDIYPFTQSASMDTEQFENSMEFVRNSASGATVHDGLFTRASNTSVIDAYLTENGF